MAEVTTPIPRMEVHSHTDFSNLRMLDSINKPETLISRANEIGLAGICITDHECMSVAVRAKRQEEKVQKINPAFKVGLGNEIYLCPDRSSRQKYFHFILIAKNKKGFDIMKRLSSIAWINSFSDRGLERTVTTYEDLYNLVSENKGNIIATSACIGGQISSAVLEMIKADAEFDVITRQKKYDEIVRFCNFCKSLFGDDFYIEIAPACSKEQIAVNKKLYDIAKAFDFKMVVGSDAHYLKQEDRYVHKAYLNSKNSEREVDSFYEYCYLQDNEQEKENLRKSYGDMIEELYPWFCDNSMEIWNKIENYSIYHKQVIPKVEVKKYEKAAAPDLARDCPTLKELFESDDVVNRYWVNECFAALARKGLDTKLEYVNRLEEEAAVKKIIGEKLETNMFAYPVTLQHYVDMFWECGSTVGAGRGSSCSGLNHYLLGITQLDPIKWDLPFWRYLNVERTELGDIDLDLDPNKRPAILNRIKEERGSNFDSELKLSDIEKKQLGCTLVATFGTETSKSACLTACRGYRSEEYPDGIDVDTAQYLSSLIPVERGFVWSLTDVIKGNPEKDRKPVSSFVSTIEKYPRLEEILFSIEGLIKQRGSHASGVIFFDENPYDFGYFMKTPSGEICTQLDLHDAEAVG